MSKQWSDRRLAKETAFATYLQKEFEKKAILFWVEQDDESMEVADKAFDEWCSQGDRVARQYRIQGLECPI